MQLWGGLFVMWICCYVAFAQTEQSSADIRSSASTAPVDMVQQTQGISRLGLVQPPSGLHTDPTSSQQDSGQSASQEPASQVPSSQEPSQVPSSQEPSSSVVGGANAPPRSILSPVVVGERHPNLATFNAGVFESIGDVMQVDTGVAGSSSAPPQGSVMNGVAGATYTDSRYGAQGASFAANWRRVGKLWMKFGGGWYVCSASVIGRSLLVTAAHCVHNYGQGANGWPVTDPTTGQLQVRIAFLLWQEDNCFMLPV